MTRSQALQKFFSGFGIPAYESMGVPNDVVFPYLTYQNHEGIWGGGKVSITVNIWDYAETVTFLNQKSDELSEAIGRNGVVVNYDGGAVWITKGSPFSQTIKDEQVEYVKGKYINLSLEALN